MFFFSLLLMMLFRTITKQTREIISTQTFTLFILFYFIIKKLIRIYIYFFYFFCFDKNLQLTCLFHLLSNQVQEQVSFINLSIYRITTRDILTL